MPSFAYEKGGKWTDGPVVRWRWRKQCVEDGGGEGGNETTIGKPTEGDLSVPTIEREEEEEETTNRGKIMLHR